jgi:hypothetical protein
MSNDSAISWFVRAPCRISLLAAGGGVGVAVCQGVGRGVGRGVDFAVGRVVGRAAGVRDGTAVACGVGVGNTEALGAGSDGDRLQRGEHVVVGTWVVMDTLGEEAGEMEPGAAGPQLTTISAAPRANLAMER